MRQAIALQLYAQDIFTLGQARRLADLSVWEFQTLLAQHKIQHHYDETDLDQDIQEIQARSWQLLNAFNPIFNFLIEIA
jgi:predicted HTH domain antitoxin